jgi:hypothetical protein
MTIRKILIALVVSAFSIEACATALFILVRH